MNTNDDEIFFKGYQWSKIQSAPDSPETEIKCRPQAFKFEGVLPLFQHEHVTDFSGRDRLLSSWFINEFLKLNSTVFT